MHAYAMFKDIMKGFEAFEVTNKGGSFLEIRLDKREDANDLYKLLKQHYKLKEERGERSVVLYYETPRKEREGIKCRSAIHITKVGESYIFTLYYTEYRSTWREHLQKELMKVRKPEKALVLKRLMSA